MTLNEKPASAAPPNVASVQDAHRYVETLSTRDAAEDIRVRAWQAVERVTLLVVLAASIFTYYMLTVIEEIIAMPHLEVTVMRIGIRALLRALYA